MFKQFTFLRPSSELLSSLLVYSTNQSNETTIRNYEDENKVALHQHFFVPSNNRIKLYNYLNKKLKEMGYEAIEKKEEFKEIYYDTADFSFAKTGKFIKVVENNKLESKVIVKSFISVPNEEFKQLPCVCKVVEKLNEKKKSYPNANEILVTFNVIRTSYSFFNSVICIDNVTTNIADNVPEFNYTVCTLHQLFENVDKLKEFINETVDLNNNVKFSEDFELFPARSKIMKFIFETATDLNDTKSFDELADSLMDKEFVSAPPFYVDFEGGFSREEFERYHEGITFFLRKCVD